MKPNLSEIEEALTGRTWITLEASTVTAWIFYTRALEALELEAKPESVTSDGKKIHEWAIYSIDDLMKPNKASKP